jgi:hypothetical protein
MSKFTKELPEDFLEVDQSIPGQNFVCLSFVTPERILKKKEVFKASKFLEHIFTNEERTTQDIRAKLSSENKDNFSYDKINELYEDWKYTRDQQLEEEFHKIQNFQTTIQGIKIRGVYSTEAEARAKAKKLHQQDPNFHVYIAPVGHWLPYEPNPDAVQDQEHHLEELNQLTKQYFKNQEGKDELYQQMKQEQLNKARKELEERKKKLREETQQEVRDTTQEDIKNIEELRKIVDESDKGFYDNVQKKCDEESAEKSMSGLEGDDPWIQRKKEQEKNKEEENSSV